MSRRVIVFYNQPIAISETFVYNQIAGLKRYQPIVIGIKHPQGPEIDVSHLNIHLINQGGIIGTIREIGIKVLGYVPNDIDRLVDQVQPHLIHAHFAPYGAIAMPLARQRGLPLLVSVHGTDVTMSDTAIWRSSYMAHRLYLLRRRALAQMVSRVIVQSDFLHRIVVERHGFAPAKVVCIRHGIDVQRFNPKTQMTVWGKILYVGRLAERKGLPFLLHALARLRNRFPEIQLTVIGDGPMRQQYEALGRDLLGQRVTFLGAQPNKVVQQHLAEACIFCMPSITMPSGEAETLGMVFLEAMAMQVPPVSFRSGGIPEVIIHGQTGFLAHERDVEELAHYIEILLADPDLRHRLGVQGRQWVEQEFNLEKQNAKLESLYDEVVDEYHH
ncbi:MAG TPA: glycosyl transferase family 1 [Chloroflexus aurantiacus]|uniref:Glycosyl transferase group 1 n=1 Tax=Chloroflexus aurantiacus (strain ATCC 29366 / DSM 635 / J-10-fl) TaxID=324602 RepID=A9WAU8_CHLAA|nr:glycosyltransferase [Chloroflexus aurantiacus]ABY34729.1 glycosyl transferase group 1 [Chloroflexus aurantiacus J-10-fl]HBW67445.1 glycosyl transferase family 1 [Chloroflexus aurantiacus]